MLLHVKKFKGNITLFSLIEFYFILKTTFVYFMNVETLSRLILKLLPISFVFC